MSKGSWPSSLFTRMLGAFLAAYLRFVYRSSRLKLDPANNPELVHTYHPALFVIWHGQYMLAPLLKRVWHPLDLAVMIALHGDSKVLRDVFSRFGIHLLLGAGAGLRRHDRGGASAMRATLKALRNGTSILMTADVPPGPFRQAGRGIISIARLSGRPIIPGAITTSRHLTLNSPNRFRINLPCSSLALVIGDPIHIPRNADEITCQAAQKKLTDALNAVHVQAYTLAGVEPDPVFTGVATKPKRPGNLLRVYRHLTSLLGWFLPTLNKHGIWRGMEDPERRNERYGIASAKRPPGPLVWFHAAGVGATSAVIPLMNAMSAKRPDLNLLLTTRTVPPAQITRSQLPDSAIHQFAPFDTPQFMTAFMGHWRPDLVILTESEIWPNLIMDTSQRDIPLALVNGARMSRRATRHLRRWKSISRPLFSRFALVLAQDKVIELRFMKFGAPNVMVTGNLKIDAPPPPAQKGELAKLKMTISGRPLFLAASIHPEEEELIAQVHTSLAKRHPELLTIIVPRHPHRGGDIAAHVESAGLRPVLRSEGSWPDSATDIYIADTVGELGMFYALAPITFIGGSLVDLGGQNPIEAIKCGTVVLMGPHARKFNEIVDALVRAGGCAQVDTAEELAERAHALLSDKAARKRIARSGREAIAAMSGALEKSLEALNSLLPPPRGG